MYSHFTRASKYFFVDYNAGLLFYISLRESDLHRETECECEIKMVSLDYITRIP